MKNPWKQWYGWRNRTLAAEKQCVAAERAAHHAKIAEAHAWTERAKMREERDKLLEWAEAVRYMAINGVLCGPFDPCNLCKPIWDAYPEKKEE